MSASKHDGSPQWQFLMHGDTPGATGDLITIPGSAFSHVELEPIGDEGELVAPDGVWATVVWLERRLQVPVTPPGNPVYQLPRPVSAKEGLPTDCLSRLTFFCAEWSHLQAIAIVAGATRGMLASQQQDLARRSLAACPPQNLPARKRRSLPQAQQLVALAQARRLASHTRLTLARALLQGHVQALCSACTCSSSGLEWLAAVETLESQAAATLASRVGPSTLADVLASSLQCLLPVRIVRSPLQPSE